MWNRRAGRGWVLERSKNMSKQDFGFDFCGAKTSQNSKKGDFDLIKIQHVFQ